MGMGTSGAMSEFARIEGSDRKPLPDAERIGGIDRKRQMDVTVVMRRRSGAVVRAATAPAGGDVAAWRRDLREQLAREGGADTGELDAVTTYLTGRGLTIKSADAGQRRIVVQGDVDQMEAAFNVELDLYQAGDIRYRGREGHVCLPPGIADYVEAVLGLDDRPQARVHMKLGPAMDESVLPHPREDPIARLRARAAPAPEPTPLWPMQVARLYDFPTDVDGTGQTIGIIELGGGFHDDDLDAYFQEAGLRRPEVIAIPNEANTPGISGADGEVALDIQVCGAIAPGSRIVVYFATGADDNAFYDTLAAAIHDETNSPSTISISWGLFETGWTPQGLMAFDKLCEDAGALGITVLVAAGDHGAGDAAMDGTPHADFPASSPHVIGCGGTTLTAGPDEKTASEVVWNDGDGWATGGGFSGTFPRPDWQATIPSAENVDGRGVPDVAGNADSLSGFVIMMNRRLTVIGGTSAVAPLYAGLFALMAEKLGHPATNMPHAFYTAPADVFRDITSGDNSTPSTAEFGSAVTGFSAGQGWDACTGLGSINGSALTTYLEQEAMTRTQTA